jgi:hypothetical protein
LRKHWEPATSEAFDVSPLKRKLTFLIVITAVAACAAGAYAATQASSASPRQAFFNDVARRLQVTPAQLRRAMDGAFADRLAAMVASGRLTKAQARAIQQRVAGSGRYPGLGWFGRAGFGRALHPGLGPGWYAYGPPGPMLPPKVQLAPGAKLPPGAKLARPVLPPRFLVPVPGGGVGMFPLVGGPAFGLLPPGGMEAAFSYLGIRPAELMSELWAGRSLAQIARAHGKSAAGLESAIEAAFSARLSRQVAAGHLTKAQAGMFLGAIRRHIAGLMNLRLPRGRFRLHRVPNPRLHRLWLVPHGAAVVRPRAVLAPA